METAHIEEFRRVAELGSFTLAARELHMTQSALSKHVAALERELSVDLFTRDKNGIALTPEGKILYQQSVNFTRFLANLRMLLNSVGTSELTDDTCSFAPVPNPSGQSADTKQPHTAQPCDAEAQSLPPLATPSQPQRNATCDQHIPSAAIRKRCHELRSQYNLTTDETCTLILFLEDAGFDAIQHELGFSRDQVADTLVAVYQKLHVTSKAGALRLVLG